MLHRPARLAFRSLLAASFLGLLAAPVQAGELRLEINDGRVTLVAQDVPVRQILAEWARVGRTRIINAEKVVGPPVTLRLEGVPESQALDIILRSVPGYMAAPRPVPIESASVFDRIFVMASASPAAAMPRAAYPQQQQPVRPYTQPFQPFQRPAQPQMQTPAMDTQDDQQDEDAEVEEGEEEEEEPVEEEDIEAEEDEAPPPTAGQQGYPGYPGMPPNPGQNPGSTTNPRQPPTTAPAFGAPASAPVPGVIIAPPPPQRGRRRPPQ